MGYRPSPELVQQLAAALQMQMFRIRWVPGHLGPAFSRSHGELAVGYVFGTVSTYGVRRFEGSLFICDPAKAPASPKEVVNRDWLDEVHHVNVSNFEQLPEPIYEAPMDVLRFAEGVEQVFAEIPLILAELLHIGNSHGRWHEESETGRRTPKRFFASSLRLPDRRCFGAAPSSPTFH